MFSVSCNCRFKYLVPIKIAKSLSLCIGGHAHGTFLLTFSDLSRALFVEAGNHSNFTSII